MDWSQITYASSPANHERYRIPRAHEQKEKQRHNRQEYPDTPHVPAQSHRVRAHPFDHNSFKTGRSRKTAMDLAADSSKLSHFTGVFWRQHSFDSGLSQSTHRHYHAFCTTSYKFAEISRFLLRATTFAPPHHHRIVTSRATNPGPCGIATRTLSPLNSPPSTLGVTLPFLRTINSTVSPPIASTRSIVSRAA